MTLFPPSGSPADTDYLPPRAAWCRFPVSTGGPGYTPDLPPAAVFPPPGSPADAGYRPPRAGWCLFPDSVGGPGYTPDLPPAAVFPPAGSPRDIPYRLPPADGVTFPKLPPLRVVGGLVGCRWSAAVLEAPVVPVLWAATQIKDPAPLPARWGAAALVGRSWVLPWISTRIMDRPGWRMPWQPAGAVHTTVGMPWWRGVVADVAGQRMPWRAAALVAVVVLVPLLSGRIVQAVVAKPWGASTRRVVSVPVRWALGLACDVVVPCPFGASTLRDRADINWPIIWPIEPDPVYEIPDRGTYPVRYSVSVVTLPDRVELDVGAIAIQFSLDQWAITLSTTVLSAAHYARIRPQSGEAVAIEVTVQGYVLEFLVDLPAEKREFGADDWTLTATSTTIRQGAPYARPGDRTSTSIATAQQLALDELPLSGWALQWDAVDWQVDAGAWAYQGLTPVQAIARLADAAGAALQSELAGQALRVVTRWPVMPWDLPDATPDYSIPLGACLVTQQRPALLGTRPNAVHVHGSGDGGILGHVVRNGTAGDIDLATVVNALMTDSVAARAYGGSLLAAQYQPPELQSITLPLSDAAGDQPLIDLGKIIALTDVGSELLAIATALTLQITPPGLAESEGPEITQTVTLHGASTTNAWSRLQHLSPSAPLQVGSVVAITATGATVQLVGGGLVKVLGAAALNDRVYVRAGAIEGPAPDFAVVEIGV